MPKPNQNLVSPNLPLYIREMSEQTPVRVVLNLFNQLTFMDKLLFIKNNLFNLREILTKDFIRGLLIFIELEILIADRKKIQRVVLSHYALDLVAAFGQERILKDFMQLVERYNLNSGLETYNYKLVADLVQKANLSKSLYILDKG